MIDQYPNKKSNKNLRQALAGGIIIGAIGLVGAEVAQSGEAKKMEAANEALDPAQNVVGSYTLLVRPGTKLRANPSIPKIEGQSTGENIVEKVDTPFAITNPIVNSDGWTYVPVEGGKAAWISPDAIGDINTETDEKMVEVVYPDHQVEFSDTYNIRVNEDGSATAVDINGTEVPVSVRQDFGSSEQMEDFVFGS